MAASSPRSNSRHTDWAQLFSDAQAQTKEAEAGWLTVPEWAERIGRHTNTAGRRLNEAKRAGKARCQLFKPREGANLGRVQPHWWVDGVSDEIARGAPKNKGGGYVRQRK